MQLQKLKSKVMAIKAEAEALFETADTNNKTTLDNFIILIKKLSGFFNDGGNIEALEDYDKKIDGDKDQCPLDIIAKDLLEKLSAVERSLDSIEPQRNQKDFTSPSIALNELFANNLPSAFEVLKYLSGHNKTLIILGPNGSGKTSFANYLKDAETHVKVIPASKPIKATGHMPSIYSSTIENYNNEIFRGGDLQHDLLQKLIVGLCNEHDDTAREVYDTGNKKDTTLFEKVKKIFEDFFDVRLDSSDFRNKQINASKDGVGPFSFNSMSDGERVAFFYIATVIVAPPQSFIIVDEPENHLNPAIYNKIWDRLIDERQDCQFIFISHTMEFINARSSFELVKIKNFTYPNKFDFEFLGNTLEDLNPDLIVEVVGSRKPILFCEGSKAGYDYKVYESLFGNKYTVIATGNCASVENSVVACNAHSSTYSIQSAVGIIDSDLKSNEEIGRLRTKKVYALKCNEIEMLLLDEAIFKKVLVRIYKEETEFSDFKKTFFLKLAERKEHIIKRLVKIQIDEKLRKSVIDDKSNKTKQELKTNLSNIFNDINVDTLWASCNTKITDIITTQDYDAALKYCCLEHNEVIVGLGELFVTDYATIALGVLKDDPTLVGVIKEKYFAELDL